MIESIKRVLLGIKYLVYFFILNSIYLILNTPNMTLEKWQEIKDIVQEKFEIIDSGTNDFENRPGTVEFIEFSGPLGKMRLEWTDQPLLLDKKTHGSKRIGSETKVEYVYSETERVNKFKAFKWDENILRWDEIEMEKGNYIF